jgi:hypothetical protein
MSGQFYDNADRRVYRFPAAAVDTGAVFGRFIGPLGKTGRVRGMEFVITTEVTTTVALVTCGVNGATLPAALTVAIGAANVAGAMTAAQVKAAGAVEVASTNDVLLTANTVIEMTSNGASAAGDADIIVAVDWF